MPFFSFGGKSSHRHHCRVLLLDDSEFTEEITSKTRGFELMEKVFGNLNLYEKDYFGLRFRDSEDKTQWLDPDKTIKKQIYSGSPYTLYFGVKFYAADPTKLKEELTRYQFFLQIKKDMLQGRLPCSFNVAAELCAYAVQSELGDYDGTLHTENYVSEFRFVPNQNEQLEQKIGEIHKKLRGQVPSEAELNFMERVKWLEMYGVDLHPVRGQDNLEYFLGLTPTGIVLFRNRNKIGSFIWPKITKLKFKGHNFILRVNHGKNDEEKEYSFTLETKRCAKQLWKYCAEHHTFFRLEKANDVPASAYNFLFRKGSGFRFSGRTQQELLEDNTRVKRPPPVVQRTANNGDAKKNFHTVDGKETSPPWQQRPNSQSGLYTSGHNISANAMNESAPAKVPVSARFPKPYKTTSALQSDGEMPKRKISSYHAGYSSGEEITARRKRSHYYSGYTSGASDGDAIVNKLKHRTGSEPNMHYSRGGVHSSNINNNRETLHQQENIHKHRQPSRESVATTGYDGRAAHDYRHRESGSKSDSEQNSRQRRQQHYYMAHRSRAGLSDTEMVPALKVYMAADGSQRIQNGAVPANRQRRHHHHHHHHRMSRGQVPYDPRSAKVLLELGPDSAPPESENSFTADSTASSIQDERSINYSIDQSQLNQSTSSNQAIQISRSHQAHLANHMNHSANQGNHGAKIINQFQRNQPISKQGRPVSMDMKYANAGYHYVEHGPRPPNSASASRGSHHAADPVRSRMTGSAHVENKYLQQYMPPHVVHKTPETVSSNVTNDRQQLVEQLVVYKPDCLDLHEGDTDIDQEQKSNATETKGEKVDSPEDKEHVNEGIETEWDEDYHELVQLQKEQMEVFTKMLENKQQKEVAINESVIKRLEDIEGQLTCIGFQQQG
eukprot:gene10148-11182_t